ncbi:glycosyltransferase [Streptomyces sp. NPDC007369]|uniref:glycosyltransferase n=1 Tax=Streptomyces sp. NPDC007369 TaxID=3154589 RepID=UPI0033CC0E84
MGWRPHGDLIDGLHCADLLTAPSLDEPFGLVCLEAMASGTPWSPPPAAARSVTSPPAAPTPQAGSQPLATSPTSPPPSSTPSPTRPS